MDKVVITGMSVISPAGNNLKLFWNTLADGKITYKKISELKDNNNFRIKIGARVTDQDWKENLAEHYQLQYGQSSQYAMSCSIAALTSAGFSQDHLPKERVGICIGTTMGEIKEEESISEISVFEGEEYISPEQLLRYKTENIVHGVAKITGATGPSYMIPAACAAGNYAFALGKMLIEWGYADVIIAGGVDVFSRVAFTGFQRLLSLAPDYCRPFDVNRSGLVIGEGCGIVILEKESFAKKRKATVLAEILGVGLTSDRYHITAQHPKGDGAVRAMRNALKEAQLRTNQIDYISAHGTGTKNNDKIEVLALHSVFGDEIPASSSIKSMLGHPMGAASALELIASVLMLHNNTILPTMNYQYKDPECEIDCVPNKARKAELNYIMSNSFAFGGQIGSVIIGRGF